MSIINILHDWNNWDRNNLKIGRIRKISQKILSVVHTQDIIALIGPRRSGKSTVLYQIIHHLENDLGKDAILHVNFEEPQFATKLKLELLDEIYESYRTHIYPKGRAYLFLDEIQNIPQWERWVRARNENQDVKIFITGSSAKLLSNELATLLTGRHLSFDIYPLNFKEFLQFKNLDYNNNTKSLKPPPEVANALLEYIKWGGFPRIVLEQDESIKLDLLKRYFDDVLYKDIVLRYQVRDMMMLRDLAAYLLTNSASLISFKRLANIFGVSKDLITSYYGYLEEAFCIKSLPFYSLKQAERNRNPKKNYCIDVGLRMAVSSSSSIDQGKIIETIIYNHLLRKNKRNLFYWKKSGEVDFVIKSGIELTQAIQVVSSGLEDIKTFQREISSLLDAKNNFQNINLKLIAHEIPNNFQMEQNIEVIPLWKFLLI